MYSLYCIFHLCLMVLILIVNWQNSRLIEYHANVRFRLRRSNSVFLQLQFEAFYTVNLPSQSMPNGRLFPLEIVAGKKSTYMNLKL